MKETFDPRGRQSSIFRLAAFDTEGLLHAVTIRVLTFVALIAAAVLLFNLLFGTFGLVSRALLMLVWILITPQMFELVKGSMMMATRGMAFGKLSKPWVEAIKYRDKRDYTVYRVLPYAALAVWAVLFAVLAWAWFA